MADNPAAAWLAYTVSRIWPQLGGALALSLALALCLAPRASANPMPDYSCPAPIGGARIDTLGGRCEVASPLGRLHAEIGAVWLVGQQLGNDALAQFSRPAGGPRPAEERRMVEPLELGAIVEAVPLDLGAAIEVVPAASASDELPPPTGATPEQAGFILAAAPAARESQRATGVPASVTIAQAILESAWGASRLSSESNNFFGIKAQERPGSGGVVWFDTWEVVNGANVIQREPFRAYTTMVDSFVDHGRFFIQNPRYAAALAASGDPKQFAREINRAGYATDPNYAPKLIGLMDRFNLYAYDLP